MSEPIRGARRWRFPTIRRNRVISYDIENRRVGSIDLPNIEFRIGDALEDRTELLSAPVIMLDTIHDGVFEQRVYRSLVEWRYEGLLLLGRHLFESRHGELLVEAPLGEDRPHTPGAPVRDRTRTVRHGASARSGRIVEHRA